MVTPMRQQLITWMIEDIAPEVRRTKDASSVLLKFANEKNLAPALVQGLGQLYNTAKTLAFLEKAGSTGRGDSFPIVDVDDLVKKYLEHRPSKSAGSSEGAIDRWEFYNPDNSSQDLPACFAGILTPAFEMEQVIDTVPDRAIKRAAMQQAVTKLEVQFAEQIRSECSELLMKYASEVAQVLRENPDYPFVQMEADAMGYFEGNPRLPEVMDKLAEYCGNCFPRVRVERAKTATQNELLRQPAEGLMVKIAAIEDGFYLRQACDEFVKEATSATMDDPAVIAALQKAVSSDRGKSDQDLSKRDWAIWGTPKFKPSPKPTGGAGGGAFRPQTGTEVSLLDSQTPSDVLRKVNEGLDSVLQDARDSLLGGAKKIVDTTNKDQALVDARMQDVRQVAILQNLLTTDEILAEADPDRVVEIYNTIRTTAPEVASDINVMRVLLRSAIQHDGIAPFDLKNILETELAKQKVDWNRRMVDNVEYSGGKVPTPNKPM